MLKFKWQSMGVNFDYDWGYEEHSSRLRIFAFRATLDSCRRAKTRRWYKRCVYRDDYKSIRQQMVDMVLATEMTRHFEHVNRFVSVINQPLQLDDDAADVSRPRISTTCSCSFSLWLQKIVHEFLTERIILWSVQFRCRDGRIANDPSSAYCCCV